MSNTISSGLNQVQQSLNGSSSDAKADQLAAHTVDYHDPKVKMTTDYGVKVSDTDHWLSVSTEDKQG